MSAATHIIIARRHRDAREQARRDGLASGDWRYAADEQGLRGWRGPGLTIIALGGRHLDAEMREPIAVLRALGAMLVVVPPGTVEAPGSA